jgi:hypothetical protein
MGGRSSDDNVEQSHAALGYAIGGDVAGQKRRHRALA